MAIQVCIHIIKHIWMFYLEVSISYMKMAVFLGAAKYVVGLLWQLNMEFSNEK